jgi:hypothetical protein
VMISFILRATPNFADAASNAMKGVVQPLVNTLSVIAALVCAGLLVYAGIHYSTSSGQPQKLEKAKKIMKDALIGFAFILAATTLTAVLTHAYASPSSISTHSLPTLNAIKPSSTSFSLVDVLIKAITGVLQNIVESIGKPFINALAFFTSGTPLMASNPSVFKLWLAIVAMADVLFVLAICLLGFHVMSASTIGLDDLDFKPLIPQLIMVFLLINSSIFAIDAIISLSNGLINAIRAEFGDLNIWSTLNEVTNKSAGMGLASLLITIVFLVMSVILLVYYVGRIVTLYLGAALSPLIMLLWLLPSFKDFASSAIRTYLTTIFVLFVHVVILLLASSILSVLATQSPNSTPDPIMALITGMATLLALIKTQGVMSQLSYASIGPKSLRKLGGLFVAGAHGHAAKI